MENTRIAVKSVIIKEGKVLLIKRRPNDVHKPGQWEFPGGRLDVGEDPFEGLKRETREETRLEVEIEMPVDVHYFARDDGQVITMIIFLCRALSHEIKLSEEHTDYKWVDLDTEDVPEWVDVVIKRILKYKLDSFV